MVPFFGESPLARELFARVFFKLSGRFYFVCVGKASDSPLDINDSLSGTLFIFQWERFSLRHSNLWKYHARPIIEAAQHHLRAFGKNNVAGLLRDHAETKHLELIKKLEELSSFSMHFQLDRDGESTLLLPNLDTLPAHAPHFPKEPSARERILDRVSSQLFFFLRDLAHIHQHHNASTDTIVDLYPCRDEDDYTWRCETLRCLYRKMLEYKRTRHSGIFGESLGVLAYAQSFEASSNTKIETAKMVPFKTVRPVIFKQFLVDSIKANEQKFDKQTQRRTQSSESFRNATVSVLTILFALVGLLQLSGLDKSKLKEPSPTPRICG